jgi:hypothetical protein
MRTRVERRTVNLSAYPDLVVIYLGMRVNRIAGIKTLLGFGPKISSSATAQPDGCYGTRQSSTRYFQCMLACANTGVTQTHFWSGRVRTRTGSGGRAP